MNKRTGARLTIKLLWDEAVAASIRINNRIDVIVKLSGTSRPMGRAKIDVVIGGESHFFDSLEDAVLGVKLLGTSTQAMADDCAQGLRGGV